MFLPIRFQQALNGYHMIIFHQNMAKNGFLGPEIAQMPKYGNLGQDPPKMQKIKNNVFKQKWLKKRLF